MQTVTIEITGSNALKALRELEHKRLIRIVKSPESCAYALPGEEISLEDFRQWVEYAEGSPTASIIDARQRWEEQKKELRKHIR